MFDNVLNRQFEPAAPDRAWVTDITYIRTRSGWLYLAAVLDLYARKIVGWAMAPNDYERNRTEKQPISVSEKT